MANKRLSELNELAAVDIQSDDLFLTTDISSLESKKLRGLSIKDYVLGFGHITASITNAFLANTASYIDPNSVGLIKSSSFSITSSFSSTGNWAKNSDTASYITANHISGSVPSSSYSNTASYVLYQYGNGRIENAQTASYVNQSATASYLYLIPGTSNGTASFAVSASYFSGTPVSSATASYLRYQGFPNGTASYALDVNPAITASYLLLNSGQINGTASYAMASKTSSYLYYDASANPNNGTASYSISSIFTDNSKTASYVTYTGNNNGTVYTSIYSTYASSSGQSLSSSYAVTASFVNSCSYAKSASYCSGTSSYSSISDTITDPYFYRIYGPYNTNASPDSQTTILAKIRNFVVNTNTGTGKTVIIDAIGDIKVPITQTEVTSKVYLYLNYDKPGFEWSVLLDSSKVANYVNFYITGGFAISGYNKQSFSLKGNYDLSGSWYSVTVVTDGGVTLDDRTVKVTLYSKADSISKTAFPPP